MIRATLLCLLSFLLIEGCADSEFEPPSSKENFDYVISLPDGGMLMAGTREWSQYGRNVLAPDDRKVDPTGTYLVRTDAAGAVVWEHSYEIGNRNPVGMSLTGHRVLNRTGDGGFVCAWPGSGYGQMTVLSVDSSGNEQWMRFLSLSFNSEYDAKWRPTEDGGFLGFGFAGVSGCEYGFAKISAEGELVSDASVSSGTLHFQVADIAELSGQSVMALTFDGVYTVDPTAGTAQRTGPFGTGRVYYEGILSQYSDRVRVAVTTGHSDAGDELRLYKITSAGGVEWTRTFPDSSQIWTYLLDLQSTPEGKCLLYSSTWSNAGNLIRLWSFDSDGQLEWNQPVVVPDFASRSNFCSTPDGGHVVAGGVWPAAGGSDAAIVKLDASGNFLWQHTYGY